MLVANKAIILNTIKYRESSLIVKAYTEQDGLQSFLFQGIRVKGKANQNAIFQSLNSLQLHYHKKNNQELIKVRNWQLLTSPFVNNLSPNKASILFFVNDLLTQTLKFDQGDDALFSFLESQLNYLSNYQEPASNYPCYLMIQLSILLGIAPNADSEGDFFDYQNGCFVSAPQNTTVKIEDSRSFKMLMLQQDPHHLDQITLNGQKRLKFIEALNQFYRHQLAHFNGLKSLEVLRQLMHSSHITA